VRYYLTASTDDFVNEDNIKLSSGDAFIGVKIIGTSQ